MNQEELNECISNLMQMSVEDIKNLEKYRQITELSKDFSKPKVNTSQTLQNIWEESVKQPGFQETAMPKNLMNNVFKEQGCDLKKLEDY